MLIVLLTERKLAFVAVQLLGKTAAKPIDS
jgi:hypothetical protein